MYLVLFLFYLNSSVPLLLQNLLFMQRESFHGKGQISPASLKAKLDKAHHNNLTPHARHWQILGILVGCQADLFLMAHLGLSGSRSILTDI